MMSSHKRSASTGSLDDMRCRPLCRGPRPHKATVTGFCENPALRSDTFAAQPGLDHAIGKLDSLIGTPGHEVVSARPGVVAIRIAANERNVGVAPDGQRAL